jgi:hypothetical protein
MKISFGSYRLISHREMQRLSLGVSMSGTVFISELLSWGNLVEVIVPPPVLEKAHPRLSRNHNNGEHQRHHGRRV